MKDLGSLVSTRLVCISSVSITVDRRNNIYHASDAGIAAGLDIVSDGLR